MPSKPNGGVTRHLLCEFQIEAPNAVSVFLFHDAVVIVTENLLDRIFVASGGLIADANRAARQAKAQKHINEAVKGIETDVGMENFDFDRLVAGVREADLRATVIPADDVVDATLSCYGLISRKPKITLQLHNGPSRTFRLKCPADQIGTVAEALALAFGGRVKDFTR
jgi:hypothetical protein